jgi:hypothetical protein
MRSAGKAGEKVRVSSPSSSTAVAATFVAAPPDPCRATAALAIRGPVSVVEQVGTRWLVRRHTRRSRRLAAPGGPWGPMSACEAKPICSVTTSMWDDQRVTQCPHASAPRCFRDTWEARRPLICRGRRNSGEANHSEQIGSGRGIALTFTVGHNADIESLFARQAGWSSDRGRVRVTQRRPMCSGSASTSTRGKGRVPGLPRTLTLRPVDERPDERPEGSGRRLAGSSPLSVPGHALDQWILPTFEAFAPEFHVGMDAEQTDLGRPVDTVEVSHQSVGTRGPGVGLSHE